jgi:hypothetical protein
MPHSRNLSARASRLAQEGRYRNGTMAMRCDTPASRSLAPSAPRSFCAPPQLAAYALGATLWAPVFMLLAGLIASALSGVVPALSMVAAVQIFVVVWLLRFALYIAGSHRRWDYGYGINGVIVNRQLTLTEKLRRIARDWFGVMLVVVWVGVMTATTVAAVAGG